MAGEQILGMVSPDPWAKVVSREHSTHLVLDSGVLLAALDVSFSRRAGQTPAQVVESHIGCGLFGVWTTEHEALFGLSSLGVAVLDKFLVQRVQAILRGGVLTGAAALHFVALPTETALFEGALELSMIVI